MRVCRGLWTLTSMLVLGSCLGTTNEHLASLDSSVKSVAGHVDQSVPRLTQDADRIADHIEILNQSLAKMAESIAALEKMSAEVMRVVLEGTLVNPNPPAEPPGLDQILNGPSPSPSAAPSTVSEEKKI